MDMRVYPTQHRSLNKYIYTHAFSSQVVNRLAYGVVQRALVNITRQSSEVKTLESIELHTITSW